jgi:2-keto-4-pentenoate hydratase/2-oxohepta-3-ene-1,7-dioic acid hydratase in catechol pathway
LGPSALPGSLRSIDADEGDRPLIGPDDELEWPDGAGWLEFRPKIAAVLGRAAERIAPEDTPAAIFGYTLIGDWRARDESGDPTPGADGVPISIGPWIVTPDEIPDPHDLAMELRVNGEPRQVSHSKNMSVTIPEILSHYSPLGYSAGDVVSTGTVSGVAGFSDDPASLYLKPGDVMEAEIERIGVLRNPVVSWQEGDGEPAPERVRW